MQGHHLYGKALKLSFSKKQSDFVSKLRGEYAPREVKQNFVDTVKNKEIKKSKKLI